MFDAMQDDTECELVQRISGTNSGAPSPLKHVRKSQDVHGVTQRFGFTPSQTMFTGSAGSAARNSQVDVRWALGIKHFPKDSLASSFGDIKPQKELKDKT